MNNVAHFRHKFGLTQLELAEKLGVAQSNVAQIERGNITASTAMIRGMIEIFGVTAGQIIGTEPLEEASQ